MSRSICFVGMDNYPVIGKLSDSQYIGGESVQQTLLARAFHALGYDVSMVVRDHGQPDEEVIDGIRILKGFINGGGLPVLRFVHPRTTTLVKALKRADADIYFQSCAGAATGIVAWHCRRHRRRFLFRLAHDSDCVPGKQLIRFWRDRKLYEYGLRHADLISAQGVAQEELLRRNYHLESVPVNMAVELPAENGDQVRDIDVLWVNNLRNFKRPDIALNVARALPDVGFTMIGGPVSGYEDLYADINSKQASIANLRFEGAVPYARVNDYFSRSKLFVNTSDQEGFPNSYLQAWIRSVPVVAFFDPDGLIARHTLGVVPADQRDMVRVIGELLDDEAALAEMGQRCRDFALSHYAGEAVARQYERLLGTRAD